MGSIIDVLRARRGDIVGYPAKQEDVDRLASIFRGSWAEELILVYRELSISGMAMEFVSEADGTVDGPGPGFRDSEDYDPDRQHELDWLQPGQIAWNIESANVGRAVFAAGFVAIGNPGIGGDPYYLKAKSGDVTHVGVYRVWWDWVRPDDPVPIPQQAVRLVASSFADVIRVARFSKGPTPI